MGGEYDLSSGKGDELARPPRRLRVLSANPVIAFDSANIRAGHLSKESPMKRLTMIGEVTQPGRRNVYKRPDGSLTHWH